jgi:hypothetical protein
MTLISSFGAHQSRQLDFFLYTVAMKDKNETDDDLDALAEILPELKARAREAGGGEHLMSMMGGDTDSAAAASPEMDRKMPAVLGEAYQAEEEPIEVEADATYSTDEDEDTKLSPKASAVAKKGLSVRPDTKADASKIETVDSMQVHESHDGDEDNTPRAAAKPSVGLDGAAAAHDGALDRSGSEAVASSRSVDGDDTPTQEPFATDQDLKAYDDVGSDDAMNNSDTGGAGESVARIPPELLSSGASLSTATQTHEVRMPMYLPTFKPATGCTNASDFIVRCFVARLRSGITVVKHGRSRWCKSRLRILHIHPDGRSLSWKPAVGEPTSSKRPPKLDLSTCTEVRHAWSPDPLNPMFTGTAILRQKCEAANAHKSFALIFPKRTVDITAVTADQCKVLMEGFSALCFRLQVANLAGRGSKKGKEVRDEVEVATTASATLTNNSTGLSSPAGASGRAVKKGSAGAAKAR